MDLAYPQIAPNISTVRKRNKRSDRDINTDIANMSCANDSCLSDVLSSDYVSELAQQYAGYTTICMAKEVMSEIAIT